MLSVHVNFDYDAGRACARKECDRLFSGKSELLAACKWYIEWFGMADNPTMKFAQVACPSQLSSISGM